MRDSFNLALDGVPQGISAAVVREYLAGLPGVTDVHHLRIWGLSTTEVALTVHFVPIDTPTTRPPLSGIQHVLHERVGIGHSTIQCEPVGERDCVTKECA